MPDSPGTPGDDRLTGSGGDDVLNGPAGTDGNDTLTGLGGNDRLYGGRGNDLLDGGEGDDILDGGDGAEDAGVTFGTIVVFGGGDIASYRSAVNGVTVSLLLAGTQQATGQGLDTLIGIEGLYGSEFNDVLTGDDRANVLSGWGGSDRLIGGGGGDILLGGGGDDILEGGAGDDDLYGDSGSDRLEGGQGDDELYGGSGENILSGGDGNDVLVSQTSGRDQLFGGDGDDRVFISTTFPGSVLLALDGGAGQDTLWVDGEAQINEYSAANNFEFFRNSGEINGGFLVGTAGDNLFNFSSLTALASMSFPGLPPVVSVMRARGGDGHDTMIGLAGDGRDQFFGEAGDDVLRGMGGDDRLDGGAGNDRLEGGDGNDRLSGGDGNNILLGGQGNDIIVGGTGVSADWIDGGEGNDDITVGGVVSFLQGGAGIDTLTIANGGVILSSFSAANGFERFGGLTGGWSLNGTIDADNLDFSGLTATYSGATLSVQSGGGNDVVVGVSDAANYINGGEGDDILTGGSADDRLVGLEGADQLYGGNGNDTLDGYEGDDRLSGGNGDDILSGGTGTNTLEGGAGTDTYDGRSEGRIVANLAARTITAVGVNTVISIENVIGGSFGDALTGDDNANRLQGMGGADVLIGGGGADILDGGQGDDELQGGTGDDTLIGSDGYDTAVFNYAFADARLSFVNGVLAVTGPEGTDTLTGFERLKFSDGLYYITADGSVAPSNNPITGTSAADTLTGTSAADTIAGGAGDDVLNGGDGDDYLLGEAGNDVLNGGRGNDHLFGGAGNDTYVWRWENGSGRTTIVDQDGLDTLDLSGLSAADAANLTVVTGAFPGGFEVRARLADGSVATVIDAARVLRLTGSAGVDTVQLQGSTVGYEINAGAGNDRITGGLQRDTINGGDGDDVIGRSGGGDFIDGGAGTDTLAVAGLSRAYSFLSIGASSSLVEIIGDNRANATRITNVENVAFVDGIRTFDPTSPYAQVMRLYKAALNRNPDQPGLEGNVAALSTVSLSTLAGYFAGSVEFQARFGALSNQQFVEQLYVFALGRQGDVQGINLWVARLDAGSSRGEVLLGFSESAENVTRTAGVLSAGLWIPDQEALSIARLYDATLDRLPDPGGLTAWVTAYDAGMPLLQIAASFVASAEFQARYGALSNQAFVEQLYRFCLDRDGEPTGVNAWLTALNNGMTRAQVVIGFSESPEHVALTAASWLGGIRYSGGLAPQTTPVEDAQGKDLDHALVSPLSDHAFVLAHDANDDAAQVSPTTDDGAQLANRTPIHILRADAFLHAVWDDRIVFVHDEGGIDAAPARGLEGVHLEAVATPGAALEVVPIDDLSLGHHHTDWM